MRLTIPLVALAWFSTSLPVSGCSDRQDGASVAPSSECTCGGAGAPDCPLQSWMKANALPALRSGDLARTSHVMQRIAALAPPGYAGWRELALAADVAARDGDLEGVRASCKSCHDEFRARYRNERRALALP